MWGHPVSVGDQEIRRHQETTQHQGSKAISSLAIILRTPFIFIPHMHIIRTSTTWTPTRRWTTFSRLTWLSSFTHYLMCFPLWVSLVASSITLIIPPSTSQLQHGLPQGKLCYSPTESSTERSFLSGTKRSLVTVPISLNPVSSQHQQSLSKLHLRFHPSGGHWENDQIWVLEMGISTLASFSVCSTPISAASLGSSLLPVTLSAHAMSWQLTFVIP